MNRPIRVGVFSHDTQTLVCEATLDAGVDIVVGAESPATVCVPGWNDAYLVVVEGEELIFRPGMRVNVCDAMGENRIVGTFAELFEGPEPKRITVGNRRVNVLVNAGFSLFIDAQFEPDAPQQT